MRCDLCAKLGCGQDGHKREFCYIDPASKFFNRNLLERRIKYAQLKGIVVPAEIMDMLNNAPQPA